MTPRNIASVLPKNAQIHWDDLAIILAIVEHGSVAAAASALSVNPATVLRRTADFETRTAMRLFDKTTRGYQISPDRQALVAAMRDAMQALGTVEKLIDHARPKLEGGVRIRRPSKASPCPRSRNAKGRPNGRPFKRECLATVMRRPVPRPLFQDRSWSPFSR
ncbi:MAG: LysR family transcriptional regulator [Pseudomonadota bacterium]